MGPVRRRLLPSHPASRMLLALAAATAVAPVRADPPALAAPTGVTTPGPIRQLFLDPVLADARAVGSAALSVRLETTNNWSVPTFLERGGRRVEVQTDDQSDALVLAVRLPWSMTGGGAGWRGRFATTLGWRVTAFWGGFEDGGIEAWHHLIASTNFMRDRFGRDRIRLRLAELGGTAALDVNSGRISPGDLVVGTQALLASGGASRLDGAAPGDPSWGVAARLDLKLPTGALSRAGGSGGTDAGLSILATFEAAPWLVLHGRVSGTVVSPLSSAVPLQPNRLQAGAEVSAVFLAGRWAFVIEDRVLSPLFGGDWNVLDGGNDQVRVASAAAQLFWVHNQITGAIRYGPAALSFSEDFTPGPNRYGKMKWFYDTNAPDLVLAFSLTVPL